MLCPLCSSINHSPFYKDKKNEFFECHECGILFRPPSNILSILLEKKRYDTHQNSDHTKGYINFVKPITDIILDQYTSLEKGLDFGSGPESVIAAVVAKNNIIMDSYDLFYHNNKELLEQKYNYISACEVIEHFKEPYKEFKLLFSMLATNGALICKTDIHDNSIDFKKWYYKNDPTHVIIFRANTFSWIAKEFKITCNINDRVIVFKK